MSLETDQFISNQRVKRDAQKEDIRNNISVSPVVSEPENTSDYRLEFNSHFSRMKL